MFGLCWSGTIKSAEQKLLLESVVGEQMEAMRDGGRTGSALSGERWTFWTEIIRKK